MMKKTFAWMVLGGLVAIGCNKSSEGGGSGNHNTFTVSGPVMPTSLKQGEKQTVKLTLDRGSDFKQAVTFKADAPTGLKVVMNSTKVTPGDPAELSFTVEAEKNAPLGEQDVKITATPDTGKATMVDVKVKVTEGPKT